MNAVEQGPHSGFAARGTRQGDGRPLSAQIQPTRRALPQEVELTRISLSSRRRDLKQSRRAGTKRKAVAIIQQSCSDSLAIANPFG
jgi:hypothetical protein